MAVLNAVRSTGRRGWPAGGHTPPITVARAMVCALISAAKNMISATTKMIMARTELGRRFPASGAGRGHSRFDGRGWATHFWLAALAPDCAA